MSYNTITVAQDQGLATLTLNAPDKLNAVSRKMIAELKDCWETLAADGSVRAVLLTGAGRGFCAGADLSDHDRGKEGGDSGSALDKFFNPTIRLMRSLPKPIVAAVNGVAAGVGVSLALACDLIVAAESAYFLLAFRRIGVGCRKAPVPERSHRVVDDRLGISGARGQGGAHLAIDLGNRQAGIRGTDTAVNEKIAV